MTVSSGSSDGPTQPMRISQLYLYPIKSLRPTKISKTLVTKEGFPYDRQFMLLKDQSNKSEKGRRYRNMAVAYFPEMTLFLTDIKYPEGDFKGEIAVTHSPPNGEKKTITVPLQPDTAELDPFDVDMHGSRTTGFNMGDHYNSWFTSCFGYPVVFVYIGSNRRPVLFPEFQAQPQQSSWLSSIASTVSSLLGSAEEKENNDERIGFQDVAPYLFVSQTSSDVVSQWLPEGEEMDISKFRPNVVLSGSREAWEEDYWGEVTIIPTSSEDDERHEITVPLVHNCIRCASLNIDFATGKPGSGKTGEVLKMLQKDRRVDKGKKYSAVFGRYGFLKGEGGIVSLGNEVRVSKRNAERTVFGGLWTFDSERRAKGL